MNTSIIYLSYFVGAYTKTYSIQEKGYPCHLYIQDNDRFLPYISGSYISHCLRDQGDVLGVKDTDGRVTRTLRKPFDLTELIAVLNSLGFYAVTTPSNSARMRSHAIWYRNRYLGRIYG